MMIADTTKVDMHEQEPEGFRVYWPMIPDMVSLLLIHFFDLGIGIGIGIGIRHRGKNCGK
jgi:hypothetical protein